MIRNRIVNLSLASLALAGMAVPSMASAQSDAGKNREAREALDTLGACLASERGAELGAYLRNPSEDSWYPVTRRRNDEAPCVGLYAVTANLTALRGAAAEGWYLARHAGGAPASFATAENTAPSQEESVARITAVSEDERPQVIVDEFARCVAATAPAGVDKLLRTPVASSAENAAIGGLSASFAPCAFEGQKLGFDAETLRAALAFALARRAIGGVGA